MPLAHWLTVCSLCCCFNTVVVCKLKYTFSLLSIQPLFAYVTQEKYEESGWSVFKPIEEFRRQVRRNRSAALGLYKRQLNSVFLHILLRYTYILSTSRSSCLPDYNCVTVLLFLFDANTCQYCHCYYCIEFCSVGMLYEQN